ncbi:head-tail connector protein [Methylopila sp. 73B]|uniref:head-tail connector protein n=1 Tax=Methylopila sp. 73B TaxID=1120792 RepID=UPI000378A624|nr:head-tail connector protein [Methylopila sp. 73B]
MSAITVANVKAHLNITGTSDDEILGDYIEAAEEFTSQFVGPITAASPASIKQAVRLLVGSFYEHREDTVAGVDLRQLPLGFWQLIAPHRWPETAA